MFTDITNDQGVVLKKYHTQYQVRTQGKTLPCSVSTNFYRSNPNASIAVGDRVRFAETHHNLGMIVDVLPRENKFSRPAPKPGMAQVEQIIASNIDQIVPVFSTAKPTPKWRLLDRYLVAAEAAEIPAVICISKLDLTPKRDCWEAVVADYRKIGYRVLAVSAQNGKGLAELKDVLRNRISVFVGKSGVGKTSLLNVLQPDLGLRIQEVTRGKKSQGRHTTTHLEMFSLDPGGFIMDTPGIREFGLWDIYPDELAWCFPEMRPYLGQCKFGASCLHIEEPGCAVRKAVMGSKISPYRYQSYNRLLEELS